MKTNQYHPIPTVGATVGFGTKVAAAAFVVSRYTVRGYGNKNTLIILGFLLDWA